MSNSFLKFEIFSLQIIFFIAYSFPVLFSITEKTFPKEPSPIHSIYL